MLGAAAATARNGNAYAHLGFSADVRDAAAGLLRLKFPAEEIETDDDETVSVCASYDDGDSDAESVVSDAAIGAWRDDDADSHDFLTGPEPDECIIYAIVSRHRKVYVGQTSRCLKRRWREHCALAEGRTDKRTVIGCAIKKYGPASFVMREVERCPKWEADAREAFYIATYRSLTTQSGYNVLSQRAIKFN